MSQYVSKENNGTRIRNGAKQPFVKSAKPSRCLANHDELSFDRRSEGTRTSVFAQRDTPQYIFNRRVRLKDILQKVDTSCGIDQLLSAINLSGNSFVFHRSLNHQINISLKDIPKGRTCIKEGVETLGDLQRAKTRPEDRYRFPQA